MASVESWAIMGGTVLYATRATRDEAERLVESDRHLIEKFGPARIEASVIRIDADESIDVTDFVFGGGAHVNADGETVAGAPTFEIDGRLATSWCFGLGPSVEVWLDEIPLLEYDVILTGRVCLTMDEGRVCTRIDPGTIRP